MRKKRSQQSPNVKVASPPQTNAQAPNAGPVSGSATSQPQPPQPAHKPQLPDFKKEASLKDLENDKYFVEARAVLMTLLKKAVAENEKAVDAFLQAFMFPIAQHVSKYRRFQFGRKISHAVEEFCDAYIAFVNRFRVSLVRDRRKGQSVPYRLIEWQKVGPSLHAEVYKDSLVPAGTCENISHGVTNEIDPDVGAGELFDGEDLRILEKLRQQLLPTGKKTKHREQLEKAFDKIKFLHIDDDESSSILTQIESLAYTPDGLAFIVHRTKYPYVMLLIGEQVSIEDLRALLQAIPVLRKNTPVAWPAADILILTVKKRRRDSQPKNVDERKSSRCRPRCRTHRRKGCRNCCTSPSPT